MKLGKRGRGTLIAIEGIDGAGKSTLTRALASALRRRGWSVAVHREPVDRRLGALAQAASVKDAWTGAVYFTVDRHLAVRRLRSRLARYDLVLTDRSFYSTLAYQGSALPARDRSRLETLQREATVAPDQVLLVWIPPEFALGRVGGRRGARGPLERRRTLERVARAYRTLARRPGWTIVDGQRPVRSLVVDSLRALGLDPPRRTRSRP